MSLKLKSILLIDNLNDTAILKTKYNIFDLDIKNINTTSISTQPFEIDSILTSNTNVVNIGDVVNIKYNTVWDFANICLKIVQNDIVSLTDQINAKLLSDLETKLQNSIYLVFSSQSDDPILPGPFIVCPLMNRTYLRSLTQSYSECFMITCCSKDTLQFQPSAGTNLFSILLQPISSLPSTDYNMQPEEDCKGDSKLLNEISSLSILQHNERRPPALNNDFSSNQTSLESISPIKDIHSDPAYDYMFNDHEDDNNTRKDATSVRRFGYCEIVSSIQISLRAMLMRCEDFDRTGHCHVFHCQNAHICRDHLSPIAPKLDCKPLVVPGAPYCPMYLPSKPIGLGPLTPQDDFKMGELNFKTDLITEINSDSCATRLPTGQVFICGNSICGLGADCVDATCIKYHVLNVRVCKNANVASICHNDQPYCVLNHPRSDVAKYCVHFNSHDCHKRDWHLPHRCLICSSANHGSVLCPYLYGIQESYLEYHVKATSKRMNSKKKNNSPPPQPYPQFEQNFEPKNNISNIATQQQVQQNNPMGRIPYSAIKNSQYQNSNQFDSKQAPLNNQAYNENLHAFRNSNNLNHVNDNSNAKNVHYSGNQQHFHSHSKLNANAKSYSNDHQQHNNKKFMNNSYNHKSPTQGYNTSNSEEWQQNPKLYKQNPKY